MKEQIEEVFKGMTVDDLKELKVMYQEIHEDAKNGLNGHLLDILDNILNHEKSIFDIFFPIITTLGSGEVIDIIEEIERRRGV